MTVTLITGANKGLGYETARRLIDQGHTVYMGARSTELGGAAASDLGGQFVQLDVTDDASVEAALAVLDEREGHLDVLVNMREGARRLTSLAPSRCRSSTPMQSVSSVSHRPHCPYWKSPIIRW